MKGEQETNMNDIVVEATGLPLRFPDPRAEAYARAQEFRRLPPQKRLEYLLDVIETGMILIRQSPKRRIMDQLFLKREAEWQRIQQELFAHGK
jgi:hypothetical protein